MTLTPRRRALVALLVSWPIATAWLGWMALTVLVLLEDRRHGAPACPGPLGYYGAGCDIDFDPTVAVVELVAMFVVGIGVAYLVARWVVAPVRAMAETVDRLGPTSLGLRLRRGGPRDETRALADAVDAMLDRVAEGYESQRRFAANASHELRTPLATQRALIEVSLAQALTAEQLDLLSRQLLATNERNETLIDGLLTLAETDRGLMSRSRIEWDALVRASITTLEPTAAAAGVTVHVDLAPTYVIGERALLERLATNLVQNAVKYNEPSGWVGVDLAADATLTVTNSGPVVPPDQVGALFEPFRRLGGERLEHSGGAGLGLTIARSVVAAHDGAIDAFALPDGGLAVTGRLPPAP